MDARDCSSERKESNRACWLLSKWALLQREEIIKFQSRSCLVSLPKGEKISNCILLNEITASVEKINDYIEQGSRPVVQKAHSSPHVIMLTLRLPGMSFYLYFGRGQESQGIAFNKAKLNARDRIYDSFLGLIRGLVVGAFLEKVHYFAPNIIQLKFKKKNQNLLICLSWIDEKLYFGYLQKSSTGDVEGLIPWINPKKISELNEVKLEECLSELKQNKNFKNIGLCPDDSLVEQTDKAQRNYKKSLNRKIQNIKKDLERAKSWKLWQSFVQSAQEGSIDLENIEQHKCGELNIKFKNKKHHHKIDEIYQQIKRFKAREDFISQRLETYSRDAVSEEGLKQTLSDKKIIRKPVWIKDGSKRGDGDSRASALPESIKSNVGTIMIGRSSDENDQIRKEWAKKEDMWFHFEELTGPHMFLKQNGKELGQEEIQALCSMLMESYDKELLEAKFVYTAVKNIKGVSGRKGLVTYQKARFMKIIFRSDWRQILSMLPD
jgi:hypothetical protein